MGDDKKTPYLAAGTRLRERRKALQRAGRFPGGLAEIAQAAGATTSSYQAWERGEYWPKGGKRKKLADLMGWSEIELDHGPQLNSSDSPEVTRLILAFGWLMEEEKANLLAELEAKATVNKTIAKQLGPRFSIASDATYLEVLKKGGDFPPGSKPKKSVKPRRQRFKEEDPE